jgi:hypothetical protein
MIPSGKGNLKVARRKEVPPAVGDGILGVEAVLGLAKEG